VSDEAAAQARDASDAALRQTRALEGLAETSRGLALLADRLRRSTGRFTLPSPSDADSTGEIPAPNDNPNDASGRVRSDVGLAGPGRSLTAA
jgi:hypothetical protein